MKKGNRVIRLVVSVAALALLTGCGMLNDYVSEQVAAESENAIQNSAEYRQYKQYKEEGLLAENGLYATPEPQPADDPTENARKVRVTIAKNSFLDCTFYTDEQSKEPIESSEVWLAPGECLYCANVTVNNPVRLYDFSCFRIWSYDQNGERSTEPYGTVENKSGLILEVPEEFSGDGFSIEALGTYTTRQITTRVYYLKDGEEKELQGFWEADGQSFQKSVNLSPVENHTVAYDYSNYKDTYYFADSIPEGTDNKYTNKVSFDPIRPSEDDVSFSVQMHPFIKLSIHNSSKPLVRLPANDCEIQSITINGEDVEQEKLKQADFDILKLEAGDMISIRVGKNYKIVSIDLSVGTAIPVDADGTSLYEYSIVVPDTDKNIHIEVTERNSDAEGLFEGYNAANADISVIRADGTPLRIGEEKPNDKEKVTLKITPHEGFYIVGFNENDYSYSDKKTEYSKLEKNIQKILEDHPAQSFISIELVFADEGGSYRYKLDGKTITDTATDLSNLIEGQTLKVEYTVNSEYSIVSNWLGNAFSDVKTKLGGHETASESIKITADLDGKTIDRDTFGIKLEKEE